MKKIIISILCFFLLFLNINIVFSQNDKDNIIKKDSINKLVDKMPEPPSENELIKHKCYRQYPVMASEMGISGTVELKFLVEADGSIKNIKVVKGIGGGCDEETIRYVKSMPKWKPATKNGIAVPVETIFSLKFNLK